MKNKKALKSIWWALLLVDVSYFLILRYSALVSGNGTLFDCVVFLSWLGLCLIPVFSDAVTLGLKSEVSTQEAEIKAMASKA